MGRLRDQIRVWGPLAAALIGCSSVVLVGWRLIGNPPSDSPGGRSAKSSDDGLMKVIDTAEILQLQGEAAKSEMVLRDAVVRYAEFQDAHIALAELLIDKASMVSNSDSATTLLSEAYACYERALAIGPSAADLEFVAGTIATKIGRWDRALVHYSAARASDPNDFRYALYLAQVQLRNNQIQEAKMQLMAAAELEPDSAASWGTLAEIALREGDLPVAFRFIAKARALEPSASVWRVIEARALVRSDRPREAIELLVGLADSEKHEIGVLSVLVEGYEKVGMMEQAAVLYENAAQTNPADGQLALGAARWFQRVGRIEDAKRHAERAKMLGAEGARDVLREIQRR